MTTDEKKSAALTFHEDGTITGVFDDHPRTLRRPPAPLFFDVWDRADEIAAASSKAERELAVWSVEQHNETLIAQQANKPLPIPGEPPTTRSQINRQNMQANVELARMVWEKLCPDDPIPAEIEPTWWASQALFNQLVTWWRDHPLDLGDE